MLPDFHSMHIYIYLLDACVQASLLSISVAFILCVCSVCVSDFCACYFFLISCIAFRSIDEIHWINCTHRAPSTTTNHTHKWIIIKLQQAKRQLRPSIRWHILSHIFCVTDKCSADNVLAIKNIYKNLIHREMPILHRAELSANRWA